MEDMARLALVEQSVGNEEKFTKILYAMLKFIDNILENPQDHELRTIRSNILIEVIKCDAFRDYLKYVGFRVAGDEFAFPKELNLSNLRMAQVCIERKLSFCRGAVNNNRACFQSSQSHTKLNKCQLTAVHIQTNNHFLQRLENLFNNMLVYEDEDLQALAREKIPLVTLQLMALDRVREQQRKIKTGETKEQDLSFDIALLMELLGWFKYKFFSWVDKPICDTCNGPTNISGTSTISTRTETCRVEIYKCTVCSGGAKFVRHNDPRELLASRRGRCGEWANCFTLLCRALGYDTRYVYDTTDHVWCEIFDLDSKSWLHVDPCEAALDTPLLYSHGWRKQLSYVFAFSRDDLQDVTWRYTTDHKEVLKRRTDCNESDLVCHILALRESRQRAISEPRRRYLAKRNLHELVTLMVERKPSDYETRGRISGSKEWRMERGEYGGHTFRFSNPGEYRIRYYSGQDKYRVVCYDDEVTVIDGWHAGVYEAKDVFRKVEEDWRKAYLAREEGADEGSVSWRLCAADGTQFQHLGMSGTHATYEGGLVEWSVQFDDEPRGALFTESVVEFVRPFVRCVVTVRMRGSSGPVAWQHSQLCRRDLNDPAPALVFHTTLINVPTPQE